MVFFALCGVFGKETPSPLFKFFMCSEVVSRMFFSTECHLLFSGIKISRHAPSISHLMFADDLMVFS